MDDKKYEEFDYDEFINSWDAMVLRDKKAILADIDSKIAKVEQGRGVDTTHSAAFYERIKNLLIKFKEKVKRTVLFVNLEKPWGYDVDIQEDGIVLVLFHVGVYTQEEYDEDQFFGQSFTLIKENAKLLTVEQYAEVYGVSTGTVRQWIRRGKLRSAIKTGGEWRIPELAEVSGRGYEYGGYMWTDTLSDLPEEYKFLNDYNHVGIRQDKGNKDLFHIECWTEDENEAMINKHEFDMTSREKEKFELMLISNPLVKNTNVFEDIFLTEDEEDNDD